MADINKIIQVNQVIEGLKSSDIDLRNLDISSLTEQTSSFADNAEVIKIAQTQQYTNQILGNGLDLGAVTRIADCIKNIDDIILEKIKKKALEELLKNKSGSASKILETVSKIRDMVILGNTVYQRIKQLEDMSLAELLILAKNAGVLDQIKYFNIIREKYGAVVGNINEILNNIANLDICNIYNYNTNEKMLAQPVAINTKPPQAMPNFSPPLTVDNNSIEIKAKYEDVLRRIGEIASDRFNIV